jgi:hypothetical protein
MRIGGFKKDSLGNPSLLESLKCECFPWESYFTCQIEADVHWPPTPSSLIPTKFGFYGQERLLDSLLISFLGMFLIPVDLSNILLMSISSLNFNSSKFYERFFAEITLILAQNNFSSWFHQFDESWIPSLMTLGWLLRPLISNLYPSRVEIHSLCLNKDLFWPKFYCYH